MDDNKLQVIKNKELSIYGTLKNISLEPNYVNIGVIKKVHSKDYVDVELYYQNNYGTEEIIPDVRLLHIGTTKCKLNIQPSVGDNVLILTPKDFIRELEYNHKAAKQENGYLPYSNNNTCGILIKDESDDNVKTQVNIDENGNVLVQTEGNINVDSDETIFFDGDSFGGLCKTQELQTQLGYLTARVDAIINALEQSATGSQDGGATYKTNITIALQAIVNKEDFSNIENAKIKHGDGSSS